MLARFEYAVGWAFDTMARALEFAEYTGCAAAAAAVVADSGRGSLVDWMLTGAVAVEYCRVED